MKSTTVILTLFFLALIFSQTTQAQTEPTDSTQTGTELAIAQNPGDTVVVVSDTVVVSLGKRKMLIIKDEDGTDVKFGDHFGDDDDNRRSEVGVFGLDLGITNYFADGNFGVDAATEDLELKVFRPGSHVALHFLPTRINLINGVVNLKTALTIDYNNYYFENPVTLVPNQDVLTFDTASTATSFTRNKLLARYFQIPLMLNFDTNPHKDNSIKFSVGGYAGVLWNSKTKQVTNVDGKKSKVKISDQFNLNKFRYGVIARIDLSWFEIYAQYNLSELFADGEGPVTQTFMAGVNIIEF